MQWIATSNQVSLVLKGEIRNVSSDHENFREIIRALKKNQTTRVMRLIAPLAGVKGIQIKTGVAFFNGEQLHGSLAKRVIRMHEEKKPLGYLQKFIENLSKNPLESARKELYDFLEANYDTIPLTPDGCFMAYKVVRKDFKDMRTGRFDNTPGKDVQVPFDSVDKDRNRTCSTGLHVCAPGYIQYYSGDKVILVKVNPKDVAAVPSDYSNQKMRVSRYKSVKAFADYKDAIENREFDSSIALDRKFLIKKLSRNHSLESLKKASTARLLKMYSK